MSKELDHPRRCLVNIQNIDDNKCFKWCLVRYLHPADHNPRRIIKAYKDFAKRLDFKDIKFLEKSNSIGINIFGYENMEKYPTYVSKKKMLWRQVCWFIIDSRRIKTTLCSYESF